MKPTHHDAVRRAAEWAGVELDERMERRLQRFGTWLIEEASPAGGIGPEEADVVGPRHLADSLVFATGWRAAPKALDLGSGVGLPGIPLALVRPDTNFVLVDRSATRCRLARRAARILDLPNVTIRQSEMADVDERFPVVVSRASLPPADLLPHLRRLVEPGGRGIVGGPASGGAVPGYRTLSIPARILDRPASLLIMAGP